MDRKVFMDYLSKNAKDKEKMKEDWVEVDGMEYKFSPTFGGERINVLVRDIGKIEKMYRILFADDFDFFIKL